MGRMVVTGHFHNVFTAKVVVMLEVVLMFHLQTDGVHIEVMHTSVAKWDRLPCRLLQLSRFANLDAGKRQLRTRM